MHPVSWDIVGPEYWTKDKTKSPAELQELRIKQEDEFRHKACKNRLETVRTALEAIEGFGKSLDATMGSVVPYEIIRNRITLFGEGVQLINSGLSQVERSSHVKALNGHILELRNLAKEVIRWKKSVFWEQYRKPTQRELEAAIALWVPRNNDLGSRYTPRVATFAAQAASRQKRK